MTLEELHAMTPSELADYLFVVAAEYEKEALEIEKATLEIVAEIVAEIAADMDFANPRPD